MNKGFKKSAVLGLCAGLVLTSLAGCSKKDEFDTEAAAITVNGETVSAGVLNFAVRYTQAIYEEAYMSWGLTDPFNQDMFGDGTTLGESLKEQFATNMSHALLAEQKMEDYGVSLTDEEKTRITEAAASFVADNDEEVLEEMSVSQEDVERYLELTLIQSKVEAEMSADVDTEVSDEEAAQRRVQYTFFAPVTEEETEEDTEEATEADEAETEAAAEEATEADEAKTEAAAEEATEADEAETEDPETAGLETEEAAMSQSAEETETEAEEETEAASEEETEAETEDPETAAAKERAREQAAAMIQRLEDGEDFETVAEDMGKTATEITFGADYSITQLVEATDGLEDDTLVEEPVETDTGYYVVKLISQLDRDATDTEKESIVEERKSDRIDELYTEWEEAGEVSIDEEVLAEIVFDYHLTPYVEEETEAETE